MVVGGLVALALVLIGTWFFATFEWVEEPVEVGYSGQARTNEYYAAELLLEELGVPTESRYGLGPLPPTDHVVVMLVPDLESRRVVSERLLGWVQRGGHLVVFPPSAAAERLGSGPEPPRADPVRDQPVARAEPEGEAAPEADPFLEAAGLTLAQVRPKPEAEGAEPEAEPEEPAGQGGPEIASPGRPKPPPGLRQVAPVSGLELDGQLLAKLDGTLVLAVRELAVDDEGFSWEQDAPIGQVARVGLGEGLVTAVVDPFFLRSSAIGEHDHARLLAELVSRDGPPAGALLLLRGGGTSLASLLVRHGWMVLASLGLLVLVWLFAASRRFGPVLADSTGARRSLLEHVEASGAFLFRHGHQAELLESTRDAVRRRLSARLPAAATLEGGELAEAVSQETGMRASRVHDAFYGVAGLRDEKAFTESMRELQRLWRQR